MGAISFNQNRFIPDRHGVKIHLEKEESQNLVISVVMTTTATVPLLLLVVMIMLMMTAWAIDAEGY